MSADKKRELIELVRRSPQPKRATIAELGLSRSTFYRWQRRYRDQGEAGLVDRKPKPGTVWNRLRPAEKATILDTALQQPDLSPRELACYVTDHAGFTVSEASVYRVLKRYGLARTITLVGFPAGKEFRVKTTAPNQMWQSDASYYFVVGWGWYYSIEVLDDYSRFLLASDLKPDMTADSISDVVEQAVAFTGMRQVPIEDRTKLLSDHGSGYLARAFEEYLRMLEIRHIYCAPHHPQNNGKNKRFHETLRARMNLLVYTSPDELRRTMQDFMEYYNHRRYHEAIGNVTPADVYYGRRDEILRRRAEQKQRTIEQRLRYNLGRWNQKLMGELKPKAGLTGSEDEHREEAEKFYRELASRGARVRVGMEASGHARWFERLLAELNFELWIGDAAEIRAKRVRKQKDRSPGCTAHSALAAEG